MSTPIRVGIVGLGRGKFEFNPGLWAAAAHLPYLVASPKYEVVAVQNSTAESAQASIEYHKLGPLVKAYGNPEDLAKDPNVDLVIVSVKVSTHYALTKPALLAGKDVFVEWPLGASTYEAEELSKLAREKGSKTIVGLQARASPLVLKIRELVQGGKIGKVLSSTVIARLSSLPTFGTWPEGAEYYLDFNSGGNPFIITFGHFLDSFTTILGPFASQSSILKTDFTTMDVINSAGTVVHAAHPKSTPDQIVVAGTLKSGAVVSLSYYTAPPTAIDGAGIRWLINGTDGSIEVVTDQIPWQMGPGATLRVRIGKDAEVQTVDWKDVKEVPAVTGYGFPGQNTGRVLEAFARGDEEGQRERYASFEDAVETHKLLDAIRKAAGQ